MKIEEAFELLRNHYENHTKAAKALKISPRRYREFRSNSNIIPDLKRDWIIRNAEDLNPN